MLTLTVLGSGTGLPCLDRSGPAYHLRCPSGSALIDCGNGTLRQLLLAGLPYGELDAVFITHAHPDHIGDLLPLLHALLLQLHAGYKRKKVLELSGPAGFSELCHSHLLPLVSAPERWPEVVRITETAARFQWAGCQVSTASTHHSSRLSSLAYRFAAGDRSLVLSGDAEDSIELRRLAAGADLLVLDCSYPEALKAEGHLSATECGRLAAGVGAGKVILSHLYPTSVPAEIRVKECKLYFAGPVLLAQDLMELQL